MTSCPGSGDLSRAIKNRCVEIYVPLDQEKTKTPLGQQECRIALKQSSIFRFRKMKKLCSAYARSSLSESVISYSIAQLSHKDLSLLQTFKSQLSLGLLGAVEQSRLVEMLSEIDTYNLFHEKWDWRNINERVFDNNSEIETGEQPVNCKDELQVSYTLHRKVASGQH